jgi:hypothetical protein
MLDISTLSTATRPVRGLTVAILVITAALTVGGCSSDKVAHGNEPAVTSRLSVAGNCQPFAEVDLFFGAGRPNGATISDREFSEFVDTEVTPRFPDGLTVLHGNGQYRTKSGALSKESSYEIVILYPRSDTMVDSQKADQIREIYKQKFEQESVLRVDETPACVSF